jgi:hypothetical protein
VFFEGEGPSAAVWSGRLGLCDGGGCRVVDAIRGLVRLTVLRIGAVTDLVDEARR